MRLSAVFLPILRAVLGSGQTRLTEVDGLRHARHVTDIRSEFFPPRTHARDQAGSGPRLESPYL